MSAAGGTRSVRRTRLLKPLVFVLCLVPLGILVWEALGDRLSANPIEDVELRTGRWALRFLLITLAVTPARLLTGWNELIKYRRMLGLFCFFYATLHLSTYIGADMVFDVSDIVEDIIKHPYVTLGMTTWLLLLPLALTSTKGWIRRLGGRRWNRLHRLIYVAGVTATVHYLWAVKKDTFLPLVYLAIMLGLLGWRAAVWWNKRKRAAAARREVTGITS